MAVGLTSPAPLDLLLTFDELAALLAETGDDREGRLDAFMAAAGLHQIAEDHLHRDFLSLDRAAPYLGRLVPVAGRAAAATARAAAGAVFRSRRLLPGERRVARARDDLAALLDALGTAVAADVLGAAPPERPAAPALRGLPRALRDERLRPPNCYEAFDQRPEDCLRLVDRVAERESDPRRPVLVVGLRSSGGYLAPLCAAFLRARGHEDVAFTTVRPGRRLERRERDAFRALGATGGLALVIDDPPRTGSQIAATAGLLAEHGLPAEAIVTLIPLLVATPTAPGLDDYPSVRLDWAEWAVHDRLAPDAVRGDLEALLGERVESVEPLAEAQPVRGHLHAVHRVRLAGGAERTVGVEGIGLGWFGRRALPVAAALEPYLPEPYGVRDGLLYREWLPDASRLEPGDLRADPDAVAERLAGYVVERAQAMATGDDAVLGLTRRDGAWETAGAMLGEAFGAARQFVRPLAYGAARRLSAARRPAVVDGDMAARNWFYTDGRAAASLRKVDHLRGTSTGVLASYDPVYDLAGASADAEIDGVDALDESLRAYYEALTAETVDPERWLLYRLVHLRVSYADALRAARTSSPDAFGRALAVERAMARVHQRAMGERWLADVAVPRSGPLCAIDIDGVLETRWTVFAAIAPAGALALRALTAHGQRPVLSTGRSLAEVRDRCRAYRLAGGVAEYGSVAYDAVAGTVVEVIDEGEREALDALAGALRDTAGVHVDETHEHSVRVHALDDRGRRRGLGDDAARAALRDAGVEDRVRIVPGDLQTDFVATAVDKGRGLRALAAHLGVEDDPPLAFAAGDTASDVAMFAVAAHAYAPANAAAEVHGHARVMRASYGAGLRAAVAAHLGHRPGRCKDCRAPAASPRARVLDAALAGLDGGRARKASQALAFAAALARLSGERTPR
jgi:hydroxymethylpyrimidine pyrophosphatase-like HAD family hydrolase